jgi:alpha-galactosidase
VSEQLMRETADAMVANGMRDAGYVYLNIDDCWHGERDSLGFIQPNPEHFKSGMKALGDYIHSKGLKFGIYSCAGSKTCGGKPAGRGHEYQDALQYAKWGVDYLKYDWCFTENLNAKGAYQTMRDALYAAGRPIVFSLCEWGDNKPWEWGKEMGHLWRTAGDITACFDCEDNHGTWSSWGIMKIVEMRKDIRKYAGPGHWNDPDMLEVGNGMSVSEDRSHFTLWCMMAAPLIAGNDIRNMSKETLEILINKEVIAIDQDSLGIQGFKFESKDSVETWVKPLKNGDWAICFLNRTLKPQKVDIDWKTLKITDEVAQRTFDGSAGVFKMRDLWLKKDIGTTKKVLNTEIGGHDVLLLRLAK